jgi:hypothetical protein
MRNDANDFAEADAQYLMFDISDDELERAANNQQQAVTWQYCSQWWICPM